MKHFIKTLAVMSTVLVTVASMSCKNSGPEVEHHSESGNVDDNAVNNPSMRPGSDTTQGTGQMPPSSSVEPSQPKGINSVPDSIRPLN